MKKATATYRQTLLDIAVQHTGNAANAVEIAAENGLSLTGDVEPGTEIALPTDPDKAVVNYYSVNGYQPATALGESVVIYGGINYMGIEIDFVVS